MTSRFVSFAQLIISFNVIMFVGASMHHTNFDPERAFIACEAGDPREGDTRRGG